MGTGLQDSTQAGVDVDRQVLDVTSGSRMMWFDKADARSVFGDIRRESFTACDGRSIVVDPDMLMDFRGLPFGDGSFSLVVFDPPHLDHVGKNSWLAQKYGRLAPSWEDDLQAGFEECFRVLRPSGTLVFKWSEVQIPLTRVLALSPVRPLFGDRTSRNTHWCVFMKPEGAVL